MTSASEQKLGELVLFPMERVEVPVRHPFEVVRLSDSLMGCGREEEAIALLDQSEAFIKNLDKYTGEFPQPAA